MEVVLDPILSYLIQGVLAALGVAASWALAQLADKYGIQKSSEMYQFIDAKIEEMLDRAENKAMAETSGASFEVGNETVARIVSGVASEAPKWMKRLGLAEEDIERMVRNKLP